MTIRFGTFNLFQFCAPPYSFYIKKDKINSDEWQEKTTWLKKQIKKMDCDIIGFQEVFSHKELEELTKELGFKYYVNVDEPKKDEQNDNVYVSTTLALASKYPIKNTKEVKVHVPSIKKLNFQGHFKFSRKPIKALIELPNGLDITFYVNHFKSNRLNEFEYVFKKETTLKEKKSQVKEALENNYSKALKQRLAETSSLYFDMQKTKTPIVSVCDLNDKEFSLSIDALTNSLYHNENLEKEFHILFDAYYLFEKKIYNPHPEQKEIKRTPTSYYQGYGNVIDYIFVSRKFNKKSKKAIGKISSYEIHDEHLQQNHDGSILQSDHASVVCEVELFTN